MKKILSLLLAVMMVVSLCPISALADEVNPIELQQVEAQEEQQEEPLPEPVEEQPTEEPEQPTEEQPAEPAQSAAPAEEPAEEPAAEENEAPVLRAPAAAGAAVPAPSATNGFVEEIYFPVSVQKSQGDKLERIQGFTFDKNVTSYDVVLPEIPGAFGQSSVYFGIAIPSSYVGGSDDLYYQVYFNGVLKTAKPVKLKEAATRVMAMMYMKDIKVGKVSKMTIVVGLVNSAKTAFEYSDVYEFNLTRQASIKTMQLSAGGNSLAVSPTPDFTNEPYVRDYYVITTENSLTLNITASAGAKIYVGENEITGGKDTEIDLAQYRTGESSAKLPVTIKHDSGEVKSETTYNIYVSSKDYTPVITEQPKNTVVEKTDETPLTVAVTAEGNGTLSYQWYSARANASNVIDRKIEGATEATYMPPTKYAGKTAYYCIVTNTVDGIPYMVTSEKAIYEVKLTYLTAPKSYIISNNGYSFYENGRPWLVVGVADKSSDNSENDTFEGHNIYKEVKVAIYRTDKNESTGGELVAEIGSPKAKEGYYRMYHKMLSPQSVKGTWYYYAVITFSKEGFEDATGTSEPIAITFSEIGGLVTGLEGSGSAADPFLVHNQQELEYVKAMVEGKNGTAYDFAGQTIAFANDISLSADWQPIGGLEEGASEKDRGLGLLPFAGIIDGHGYTLTIADNGKCLLKYVRNATVKNLNIKGSHIRSNGLVEKYIVDYGADAEYNGQVSEKTITIDIENVTIKSGTKILMSGFISGYASGANAVNITNCVVEKGVVIGDDGTWGEVNDSEFEYEYVGKLNHKDCIGSFAGSFNGTIKNCVSYATVYGGNHVGGFVGMKGQSMGSCDFINNAFFGKVIASGDGAGGIVGSGYSGASGTPMVQIHNCYVDAEIIGNDRVGGIIGEEGGHKNNVDEGDVYGVKGVVSVSETHFYGKLSAKGSYVGGIVGYFHDFTKKSGEASNFFVSTCGTDRAIGGVAEGNTVVGEERYGLAFSEEDFANGTVNAKLNASESPYKTYYGYSEWIQAAKYPVFDGTAPAVEAKINAIGTPITKDSGDAIKAARDAYDALTPEQKNLVSDEALKKLIIYEKAYAIVMKNERENESDDRRDNSSVIHITAAAAAKGEQNPNTGAPAMSIAPAMLVLAAAVLVLKKHG